MTQNAAQQESAAGGPLSSVEPWDLVADAYSADLVSWSEHFARHALQLASLPPSPHIVDVACGPGTLTLLAARDGATVSAVDFSPAMVANLQRRASDAGLTIVDAYVGDGQDLPFDDNVFDGAFSMVGLIFFPDRAAGFRELLRVLRPGRRAVVSSIATLPDQAALVFEGISTMLPDLPVGGKAPLSDRDEFTGEMAAAGFGDVTIHTVSHSVTTPTLAEYWERTQRSTAPIVLLRRRLGEERWAEVSAGVFDQLYKTLGDGPVEELYAMHLAVGTK